MGCDALVESRRGILLLLNQINEYNMIPFFFSDKQTVIFFKVYHGINEHNEHDFG